MIVIQRVDHGHRSRQGPFDRLGGLLAQELRIFNENGFLAAHRTHDGGHTRIIAVADLHDLTLLEIHALEMLDKCRDEVLARLLAVTDDINACLLLIFQT
ncbi:hypothetical protein D3C81_1738550 [compost metagenome]